jgi:hypothetical protein
MKERYELLLFNKNSMAYSYSLVVFFNNDRRQAVIGRQEEGSEIFVVKSCEKFTFKSTHYLSSRIFLCQMKKCYANGCMFFPKKSHIEAFLCMRYIRVWFLGTFSLSFQALHIMGDGGEG